MLVKWLVMKTNLYIMICSKTHLCIFFILWNAFCTVRIMSWSLCTCTRYSGNLKNAISVVALGGSHVICKDVLKSSTFISSLNYYFIVFAGTLRSWSYGSWFNNYLWNQCLSPLKLEFRIPLMARCSLCNIMW